MHQLFASLTDVLKVAKEKNIGSYILTRKQIT